jgi:hypothetical protein
LRTRPAAEYSAESNSKHNDEHHKGEHPDNEDEEILRPENNAEKDKLPVNYVKLEKRISVYINERKCKKDDEVEECKKGAEVIITS